MVIAITRAVSPSIGNCELTHIERVPIDVPLAIRQHAAYEATLADLGCEVHQLPVEPDLADSVFVEDLAIVLDELAVILRPGARSRRPETASVADALCQYRRLCHLREPATLDGGDVLRIDRDIYVGVSSRSNLDGIRQVEDFVGRLGYAVHPVDFAGCLHLKSAVTQVAEHRLLVNPDWVEGAVFRGMDVIEVAPTEPHAANALMLGGEVVCASVHRQTRTRLEQEGIRVRPVDVSEIMKAEGAVTCCSLIFRG